MMNIQEKIILYTIQQMKALTTVHVARVLFDGAILPEFDLKTGLFELKEKGYLRQKFSQEGIRYVITPEGEKALAEILQSEPIENPEALNNRIAVCRAQFQKEGNYIAQYTEQATSVFPVFLSIKKGDAITLQISILASDEATAKYMTKHWMEKADATHEALCKMLAEGMDQAKFE